MMPVSRLETINPTDLRNAFLRVWLTSNQMAEIDCDLERVALAGNLRNNPEAIAALATQVMQGLIDERQLLSDLPADDPDKTIDPAAEYGERMFWENIGGQDYLVSRSVVVTIIWNGTEYVISARRAR